MLDRVAVAPGFEAALGAALADDLRAPEAGGDGSGWHRLPAYDDAPPLPEGAAPLAEHVEAPEVLPRRLAQVGLVEAAEGARLQASLRPGQRLVSREGDLWRWDGFRASAAEAGSAAALRLQQRNRLEALRRDHAAAAARSAEARAAHAAAKERLAALVAADRARREARGGRARAGRGRAPAAQAEADRNIGDGR